MGPEEQLTLLEPGKAVQKQAGIVSEWTGVTAYEKCPLCTPFQCTESESLGGGVLGMGLFQMFEFFCMHSKV